MRRFLGPKGDPSTKVPGQICDGRVVGPHCHKTDAQPSPELCGRSLNRRRTGREPRPTTRGSFPMFQRYLIALAAAVSLAGAGAAQAETISGAGATFPAPVYAKWAEMYKAQ